jgi:DNA-binding LytR/AlgR family response regulator
MKLKCVVVDDEPLAIDKMKDYIGRIQYLDLQASFDNAIDALEYIRSHPVDLMFLDIQMERLTGIQLMEIATRKPRIIVTTAYSQYALKGYELDVSDYLLKPIAFERFLKAVNKVTEEIRSESTEIRPLQEERPHETPGDFIFVKADYHMHKVGLKDILFIEGMKDYLRIHLPTERIMTLMSFMKMEKVLPPGRFMRIHKSFIISMEKIERIDRNLVLIAGHKIPIGNKYRKEFFDRLAKEKII